MRTTANRGRHHRRQSIENTADVKSSSKFYRTWQRIAHQLDGDETPVNKIAMMAFPVSGWMIECSDCNEVI
ncbi:hypothetical protein EVAR_84407_1 [Eumeta japonica]|uniref:Uncharacterized protein n=1 Tax=Eumeta variegata TaxID=151549 RepID=A0A4C1YJ40_EUMVA|nr:hypothetical protein EVAR_84407_1 [Eumeta japonica]